VPSSRSIIFSHDCRLLGSGAENMGFYLPRALRPLSQVYWTERVSR